MLKTVFDHCFRKKLLLLGWRTSLRIKNQTHRSWGPWGEVHLIQTEMWRSLVQLSSLPLASHVGRAHMQTAGKAKMFAESQVQPHKARYRRVILKLRQLNNWQKPPLWLLSIHVHLLHIWTTPSVPKQVFPSNNLMLFFIQRKIFSPCPQTRKLLSPNRHYIFFWKIFYVFGLC